jgi:putative transposase
MPVNGSLRTRPAVRRATAEILAILREAASGRRPGDVCRAHRITDTTFYRWRRRFGGRLLADDDRLERLEAENRRLRAPLAVDARETALTPTQL